MKKKLLVFMAMFLGLATAAWGQSLAEEQGARWSIRRMDRMATPSGPVAGQASLRQQNTPSGRPTETKVNFIPTTTDKFTFLKNDMFVDLRPYFDFLNYPEKLLVGGVAGPRIERGLFGVHLPVGQSVYAFASFKPFRMWSPQFTPGAGYRVFIAGLTVPLTDKSATAHGLSLRISTSIDPTARSARPPIFLLLTTNGFNLWGPRFDEGPMDVNDLGPAKMRR